MAWIRMIDESEAEGDLAIGFQRHREPSGQVDYALVNRLAQGLGVEVERNS